MKEKKSFKEIIFSKGTAYVVIIGLLVALLVAVIEIGNEFGAFGFYHEPEYSYELRMIQENQSELYEEVSEINEKLDEYDYYY